MHQNYWADIRLIKSNDVRSSDGGKREWCNWKYQPNTKHFLNENTPMYCSEKMKVVYSSSHCSKPIQLLLNTKEITQKKLSAEHRKDILNCCTLSAIQWKSIEFKSIFGTHWLAVHSQCWTDQKCHETLIHTIQKLVVNFFVFFLTEINTFVELN